MTATAASGKFLWLFQVFAVVAAGPLEVSAPSGLHGSCVCDHRNQSRVGDVMRVEWLTKCYVKSVAISDPCSDFHTINGDKKHRPHGVCSPTTHGLTGDYDAIGYCTRRISFSSCLPSGPMVVKEDTVLLQ
jgi:hypothetical protein